MRCIMSINEKFMEYSPNELVDIVMKNSASVEGFEIYIIYKDKKQVDYLKQIAFLCKKNNLYFQVHGDSNLELSDQYEFLKMLENLSDQLGYQINVVMHPFYYEDIDKSIKETVIYINDVIDKIDKNKISISLENLNDYGKEDRLNKGEITPIVVNNEDLFMTYDIGHEIADNGNITDLNEYVVPIVNNVHIHTYNDIYADGYDHKPIFKNDRNWIRIIKSLIYLKINNYDKSIVFEYDLYYCPGDTTLDRIISYCKSMDFVWERIK